MSYGVVGVGGVLKRALIAYRRRPSAAIVVGHVEVRVGQLGDSTAGSAPVEAQDGDQVVAVAHDVERAAAQQESVAVDDRRGVDRVVTPVRVGR